jgi:hypothetical protein
MTVQLRARLALVLALSVAGCSETSIERPAPLDRFYYPIGVATTHVDGTTTALLVSSSNYDLRYSAKEGGTLLSLDPALAITTPGPLVTHGAERIGSYAGPVAVADAVTCPGIGAPSAFVASRYDDQVYQFGIGAGGALSCGTGCVRGSPTGFDDPYAVTVACDAALPSRWKMAYVGYLDPPPTSSVTNLGAWVSEIDLETGASRELLLGDGPVRAMAYDAGTDRLWATTQSSGARALLHSVVLSDPRWRGANPTAAVDTIDLFPAIRGVELRTIAVGTSPDPGVVTRLFIAARLYDVEIQNSTGTRPGWDVGGVLIVLDVAEGIDGRPAAAIRAIEPLGLGVGDLVVVKRFSGPDLVVATAAEEDLLFVYDDLTGGVVHAVAHNGLGAPIVGDQSIALAVSQDAAGGAAHVYVAAFGSHLVSHFVLNPANPLQPLTFETIGGLAP